jgi:hypothetical protein
MGSRVFGEHMLDYRGHVQRLRPEVTSGFVVNLDDSKRSVLGIFFVCE